MNKKEFFKSRTFLGISITYPNLADNSINIKVERQNMSFIKNNNLLYRPF
jgi:hypothetical protein